MKRLTGHFLPPRSKNNANNHSKGVSDSVQADGTIQVHVLESVQEHLEEGVSMHHCVFSNAYYLKEDSLILSATIEGKRIETIEVSLRTLEVVQSRGVCNKNTEYHEQIVNLVNANRGLISRRMKATA